MKHQQKVMITKGLPGYGKTTWAKEYINNNTNTVIVCRDDLRLMLNNGKFTNGNEKLVTSVQESIIKNSLSLGRDVIVADTNLNPKTFNRIVELSKGRAVVETVDFTNVSLYECVKRDIGRTNSVGFGVIGKMFEQYLKPKNIYVDGLPECYIVDIDGTIADKHESRDYYEWDKVGLDYPKQETIRLLSDFHGELIFFSGRMGTPDCHRQTYKWLQDHLNINRPNLYMRIDKDQRPDYIVKKEMYEYYIKDQKNVLGVVDDRLSVCCMWLELGLPLIRIGNPFLDF